jgi:hypothetical protein
MPNVDINLATGAYEFRSLAQVNQQSINFFPVVAQTKGPTSPTGLLGTDGIAQFVDTALGVGRGWIEHKDELYAVQGTTFCKISSAGVVTNLGTVAGTSTCSLAENGESVAIVVPDGNSYFYDTTNGLVQITDAVFVAFGQVTSVVEKDFYFIFTTDDKFFNSSLATDNKGQSFNALDFGSAEVSTDKIVRAFTVQDELVIIGTKTIEFFQNIGGSDFPFQRINGAHVSKGMCARYGVVEFDNSYVYLGNSKDEKPSIWRGVPGGAVKISTDAIDNKISTYTKTQLESVQAWTYSMTGYFFVGFNFPDTTLVYDGTATSLAGRPMWHERQTSSSRWRVNNIINIYGKTLVQDNQGGKIGELSPTTYQEYGEDVTRTFTSLYVQNSGARMFNSFLELFAEQATTTNFLASPTITLFTTDNGGKSFVSHGAKSLGRVNESDNRIRWGRLGSFAYSRGYKLETSTSSKVALQKMVLNLE